MTELENRKILQDGTVICNSSAMIELLYSGQTLNGIYCDNILDANEWNYSALVSDSTDIGPQYADRPQYADIDWFIYWSTPEPWASLDLKEWCYAKCKTQEEFDRVDLELLEFDKRSMQYVIKHLIYCVDTWRSNNILWGVGRGSSVSSFILHLIGINRINPLEYNLELHEWLK